MAFLVGCSSSGKSAVANPYAAEIAEARSRATSSFERAVLADGKITHSEYVESLDRQVSCIHAHGYPSVTLYDQLNSGIFALEYTSPSNEDQFDQVEDECSTGTSRIIADLYTRMATNPADIDQNVLMVDCLHRLKLAPPSFTASEYRAYATANGKLPFNANDIRFSECSTDPSKKW